MTVGAGHSLAFPLDQFFGLHPEDSRQLADGRGMDLREAVLDSPYRSVGQVRHTGELRLGEYCILPQPLQFWHVYLHIVVGFEFVPCQRSLMASKVLRSSGCSLAPPFPHIITIPIPIYRYGDSDDGISGVSAFEQP